MGRTDWDAEEARFAEQIEGVVGGMRAWRAAHPRATFREIAEAVDAELNPLRARMLGAVAAGSPAARFTEQPGEERPRCGQCGGKLEGRGRHRRQVTTQGDVPVALEREYGVCASCKRGVFPPGRGPGAGAGDVRPVAGGKHRPPGDGGAIRAGAAGDGPAAPGAGECRDGPPSDPAAGSDGGAAR